MEVYEAQLEHLQQLVPLFDGYRQFYGKSSDLKLAEKFIQDRLETGDTQLFLATIDQRAAGFVQLYFSLSSVAAKPLLIVNDLYVDPSFRLQGVGKELMQAAAAYAKKNDYMAIKLETQESNLIGQKLYEGLGYVRQVGFYTYFLQTQKPQTWLSKFRSG